MAIKVKDTKNLVPSTQITAQQDALINSKPLPLFPEDNITLNPANLPMLQTRPYTYVPGHVAYDDQADTVSTTAPVSGNNGPNNSSSGGAGHKKQQIPIILHPEKRGGDNNESKKQRVFV
jgi:hypothetical protein